MAMIETFETEDLHDSLDDDYGFALVGRLLTWLSENYRDQPNLEQIAAQAGMSASAPRNMSSI